jgi:hypothetical protein
VPVQGGAANAAPGSCGNGTGLVTNQHMSFCVQLQPNVHSNLITYNSAIGDELFSATLSGGGVTFCTGNDYYKFNYNWICGTGQWHRVSAELHETTRIRVKYDS